MGKNNSTWIVIVAVVAIVALGVSVYSLMQNQIGLSPSVASPSYKCYNSNGGSVSCNSGQYCITGICSSSAPPSYVNSYGCYSSTGVLQNCNNSQLCYNGACVDSVAATGYYTKAEINEKIVTGVISTPNNLTLSVLSYDTRFSGPISSNSLVEGNGVVTNNTGYVCVNYKGVLFRSAIPCGQVVGNGLSQCVGVVASEFSWDASDPQNYTCNNVCSKKGKTCSTGIGLYDKFNSTDKGIDFYACNQGSSVIHVDLACLCC